MSKFYNWTDLPHSQAEQLEVAEMMLREISSGIYLVTEDIYIPSNSYKKYLTTDQVVELLNSTKRIFVHDKNDRVYTNFVQNNIETEE